MSRHPNPPGADSDVEEVPLTASLRVPAFSVGRLMRETFEPHQLNSPAPKMRSTPPSSAGSAPKATPPTALAVGVRNNSGGDGASLAAAHALPPRQSTSEDSAENETPKEAKPKKKIQKKHNKPGMQKTQQTKKARTSKKAEDDTSNPDDDDEDDEEEAGGKEVAPLGPNKPRDDDDEDDVDPNEQDGKKPRRSKTKAVPQKKPAVKRAMKKPANKGGKKKHEFDAQEAPAPFQHMIEHKPNTSLLEDAMHQAAVELQCLQPAADIGIMDTGIAEKEFPDNQLGLSPSITATEHEESFGLAVEGQLGQEGAVVEVAGEELQETQNENIDGEEMSVGGTKDIAGSPIPLAEFKTPERVDKANYEDDDEETWEFGKTPSQDVMGDMALVPIESEGKTDGIRRANARLNLDGSDDEDGGYVEVPNAKSDAEEGVVPDLEMDPEEDAEMDLVDPEVDPKVDPKVDLVDLEVDPKVAALEENDRTKPEKKKKKNVDENRVKHPARLSERAWKESEERLKEWRKQKSAERKALLDKKASKGEGGKPEIKGKNCKAETAKSSSKGECGKPGIASSSSKGQDLPKKQPEKRKLVAEVDGGEKAKKMQKGTTDQTESNTRRKIATPQQGAKEKELKKKLHSVYSRAWSKTRAEGGSPGKCRKAGFNARKKCILDNGLEESPFCSNFV